MFVYILTSQFLHEETIVRGIYTSVPAVQAAEQELRNKYRRLEKCPFIDWEEKQADVMPVSGRKWMEDV